MKTLYLFCILCFGTCAIASTNDTAKVTKAVAVKAIAEFREHPLSEEGRFAAGKVITFAEQSPDVTVHIANPLVPWLHDGIDERYRSLMLGAYIAGNVQSQLDHGAKKDDPYSGMLVVFEVYRQIKKADKGCHIPEIEKFMELDVKEELKVHLERVLQKEIKAEDKTRPANH